MRRLKGILSKVLEISDEKIDDNTSPENVESWDSFNALMLVSELEKEFNVEFTMDEVKSVKRVKDIKDALKRHGVKLNE
ncbi:acyl carrier protein [Candidatus Woesearchaeota archaeon]|nr:acyl carrier protein [Candidatus Woesearchaeota archaeon]